MSDMNVFDVVMIVTFFLINDKAGTEHYFEQLLSKKDMDPKRLACHFACALYWKDDLVKYRIEQFLAISRASEWKTSRRAQFLEATAEKLSTMPQSHCEEIFQGDLEDAQNFETDAEKFKRRYKEFYTDIKISHKEDW